MTVGATLVLERIGGPNGIQCRTENGGASSVAGSGGTTPPVGLSVVIRRVFSREKRAQTPYFTDLTGIYSVETNRPVFATGHNEARSGGRASHAEAEVIAGGVGEVLCDAEVAFGGLDGGVSQRNLDLFEGGV